MPGAVRPEAAPGAAPAGPPGGFSSRSDDELLLFEVRLQGATLSDTFPGYPVRDGVLVPLGELCRLLGLAITTDPLTGKAGGFLLQESRTFALDTGTGTVTLSGKAQAYDRSQVEVHPDDLYVDTRLLAAWLPLDLKVDKLGARITVTPREPLPAQVQADRLLGRGAFGGLRADRHHYAPVEDPYRWIETPMVDETLRLSSGPPLPGESGRRNLLQSTTYATGDLLAMSASAYVYADSQGEHSLLATLGRRNPEGGLLGPLDATEFELGEVFDPGLATISQATGGTGAFLTNFPLNSDIFGDKRTLRGNLPPGWQVELYQNGALIGFQASRADGLYEFREVPLLHGWNDFRLVFYGPQGQRREEVQHLDNSAPLVPKGGFRYRVQGEELHGGLGRRAYALGQLGLTDQVSAFAAAASVDLSTGQRRDYGQAGLQGRWNLLSAQGTFSRATQGGTAEELALGTRLSDSLSLTLKRAELQDGFISDVYLPIYGLIRNRTDLDLSGVAPSLAHPLLTLGATLRRDELVDGGSTLLLSPRLGTSVGGWFAMNTLSYQRTSLPTGASASSFGTFLLSRFFGAFALRGEATYGVSPDRHLQTFAAYLDTTALRPWAIQAGALRVVDSGETKLLASATKSIGRIGVGLEASWSSRSGWTAAVTVRMGLSREPRQGRWSSDALGVAPYGALSTQAFLDANGNGRLDPGERPLPGVGTFVNGVARAEAANAQGVLYQHSIPGDIRAKVLVNPSTLPDPMMQPEGDGHTFIPRAGHVTRLDLPVVQTGDVNGTIFLLGADGAARPLPGLTVELVDATGRVAASARAAYDGYYELQGFPAGQYQLRIRPEDLDRRHLAPAALRPLDLTGEHLERDGEDWRLQLAGVPSPEPPPRPAPVLAPEKAPSLPVPAPLHPLQPVPPAALRQAVLQGDPREAAQLSAAWLAQADLKGWAVRAQVGALPATLLEAAEALSPRDGAVLLRPWALSNGQCARQYFVAGFPSRAAAERYAAHLRAAGRRDPALDLDPPKVVPVKDLLGAEPPCSYYAD
ncbi:MAG TPA: carboxypeptidase-like regulatory domain-containing protein [Holophagaceae bacterium]|nr:carboxypeptidase-like regulatory domain-containing protein [Holophagaceae bacterium]